MTAEERAARLVTGEPDDGAWVLVIGEIRVGERIDFDEEIDDEVGAVRAPIAAAIREAEIAAYDRAIDDAARECEEVHPAAPTTTWYAATRSCADGIRALKGGG